MIFGEKIKLKVYVNQHDFVSDIQTIVLVVNNYSRFQLFSKL